MKGSNNVKHKFRDPKAKLSSALVVLEKFTTENGDNTTPHLFRYTKDRTLLKKIIQFAKSSIAATFSEKCRRKNIQKRLHAEEEIKKALDDVKRYHPLVSKKTSTEEQTLANRAITTIKNFNLVIESTEQPTKRWHKRLLRFLIKRSRPSLAKTRTTELSSGQKPAEIKVKSLAHKSTFKKELNEREIDAFRMKGISLMQNQGITFPSIQDALSSLRESPIYTTRSTDENLRDVPADSIVHLEQTLSPFPGETLILRGAFKRAPSSVTPSTPIPESFELTRQSLQTGFPHPSQHTGWALCEPLIPSAPLRQEKLRRLPLLLTNKEASAQALSKKTPLLIRAKERLKQQSKATTTHKESFISLHKQLCLTILTAAPHNLTASLNTAAIPKYFETIEEPNQIATDYDEINQRFIIQPWEKLCQAWANQTNKELLNDNPKRSFTAAQILLVKSIENAVNMLQDDRSCPEGRKSFLLTMGTILGAASRNIILQHVSEVIEFAPPQLSDFEKKVQTAVYHQLEVFLKSLNSPTPKDPFEEVRHRLLVDIHIFTNKGHRHPIVFELDNYYTSQFINSTL